MGDLFKLAVTSIERSEDYNPNIANRLAPAVQEAARRGADLVLLPECPDILCGWQRGEYNLEEHPIYNNLRSELEKNNIGLAATLSVKIPGGHSNKAFLLDRKGELIGLYRKKHPAPGEESITTEPIVEGDPFPVFDFEGVKLGFAICMDIHFPEMFRIYGLKGADLVCIPTMYMDYTGDMHESLEKARAIDSQMYIALSRYISKPYLAGKSMGYAKVIAPDGRLISSTAHTVGVAIAEFDPKWRMEFWGEGYGGNMRTIFDTLRRPDFYGDLTKQQPE